MFVYFNKEGVIKEIINDSSIRQGNANVNTVYFFIEGADPQTARDDDGMYYKALFFSLGRYTMYLLDEHGEPLPSIEGESFDISTVKMEVPYDKKKELKYFKYFTRYEMFQLPIPQEVLNYKGTVGLKFQMINNDAINTQGLIVFNIEGTSPDLEIAPDTAITIAEWNYLLANMLTPGDVYTKAEANSTFQEKLVSGTNIKTINGESILGSGDLEVKGVGETAEWGNITGTLSDQTDLQNALNAKQNTLTFDNTPTDGSSNPVTSDGIYDAVQNVREVAEGKCRTIVLSYGQTIADLKSTISQSANVRVSDLDKNDITQDIVDGNYDSVQVVNSSFNSNGNIIFLLAQTDNNDNYIIFTTDGFLYNFVVAKISDLYTKDFIKSGDIFLVTQTEVPDRWVSIIRNDAGIIRLDKLETSKIDLSGYVDLNNPQTITGLKTFNNADGIKIKGTNNNSSSWSITTADYLLYIKDSNNIERIYFSWNDAVVNTDVFRPKTNNTNDLGTSSYAWKDLYLRGKSYYYNSNTTKYAYLTLDQWGNLNVGLNVGTGDYNFFAFSNTEFFPTSSASKSLGTAAYTWKNAFLSEGLSIISNNKTTKLWENASGTFLMSYEGNDLMFFYDSTKIIFNCNVVPNGSGKDLGDQYDFWKDLYLSGKVSFSYTGGLDWTIERDSIYNLSLTFDGSIKYSFQDAQIVPRGGDNVQSLGTTVLSWKNLYVNSIKNANNTYLEFAGGSVVAAGKIRPNQDANKDLGQSNFRFNDLYLSGNITDGGSNSIAVANIANKNNFVTLTQAQYDALATKDPDTFYFIEE